MTIGNARGGVLGDALASVLDRAGYNVWREFYVNDAGNQVDLFGKSIEARYLQLIQGEDAVEFPDNGYHGDDIRELAKLIYERQVPHHAERRALRGVRGLRPAVQHCAYAARPRALPHPF